MLSFLRQLLLNLLGQASEHPDREKDAPFSSAREPGSVEKASARPMTTAERKKTSIRRPGGYIPRGDALSSKSPAKPSVIQEDNAPLLHHQCGARAVTKERFQPSAKVVSDHLGKAAVARRAAKQAIREKRYDSAWRLLHEQQDHWVADCNSKGRTQQQALSLLSSIQEDMANILRLEGRHDEALASILYCVATNARPTKAQKKKVHAYFRRCKFDSCYEVDRADLAVRMIRKSPDYRMAQELVKQWRDSSAPTGGDK